MPALILKGHAPSAMVRSNDQPCAGPKCISKKLMWSTIPQKGERLRISDNAQPVIVHDVWHNFKTSTIEVLFFAPLADLQHYVDESDFMAG